MGGGDVWCGWGVGGGLEVLMGMKGLEEGMHSFILVNVLLGRSRAKVDVTYDLSKCFSLIL